METVTIPEHFSPSVAGIAALIGLVLIFMFIRRIIFRHQAECWFCSQPVTVSYFKRNSFTCPHCDQYNGFTEDGDYNKPIPAMFNSFLNMNRPHTEVPGGQAPGRNHFLCATCQGNQATKMKQLASFIPISEVTFEVEYQDFVDQQDELYQLCPPCLLRVNREIERQDRVLAPNLHYYQLRRRLDEQKTGSWLSRWFYNLFLLSVRLTTVAATICLCAPQILDLLGTEKKLYPKWIKHSSRQSLAITALATLVLSVLLLGKKRLRRIEGFFLVLLLFIVAFPQVIHLQGTWKSALTYGNKYLLTPLCLVTSVLWLFIPYIRIPKPKRVKRTTTLLQTEQLNNYEGSSANERGGDEEDTVIPGTSLPPEVPTRGPGPSHTQQSPVRNGMDSLTLGPPGNTLRKQNDVWTSRLGNNTPTPPEMEGPRPVVHPARFNYASGSISGSAASSMVDGPTAAGTTNRAVQHGLRARQVHHRAGTVKPPRDGGTSDDDTSGISESTDEGFSSISQRSGGSRWRYPGRRERRRKKRRRRWREAASSFLKSLVLPVVFGISIGLNLSAAFYFHYKDS